MFVGQYTQPEKLPNLLILPVQCSLIQVLPLSLDETSVLVDLDQKQLAAVNLLRWLWLSIFFLNLKAFLYDIKNESSAVLLVQLSSKRLFG